MRKSVTVGIKGNKTTVIHGEEVPQGEQRAAFFKMQAEGVQGDFDEVHLYRAEGKYKRFNVTRQAEAVKQRNAAEKRAADNELQKAGEAAADAIEAVDAAEKKVAAMKGPKKGQNAPGLTQAEAEATSLRNKADELKARSEAIKKNKN